MKALLPFLALLMALAASVSLPARAERKKPLFTDDLSNTNGLVRVAIETAITNNIENATNRVVRADCYLRIMKVWNADGSVDYRLIEDF